MTADGHPDRCACGCVPNVPSLFEMAALRAERRRLRREAGAKGLEAVPVPQPPQLTGTGADGLEA
eukprot:7037119-Alexandrium_andersonii.AAC.1